MQGLPPGKADRPGVIQTTDWQLCRSGHVEAVTHCHLECVASSFWLILSSLVEGGTLTFDSCQFPAVFTTWHATFVAASSLDLPWTTSTAIFSSPIRNMFKECEQSGPLAGPHHSVRVLECPEGKPLESLGVLSYHYQRSSC